MKVVRPKVDAAYRELASAINALYQVNTLIAKDSTKEQTIGTVIDKVNALIITLQQTLSRAGIGAKPNFKPGDDKPSSIETEGGNESESPDSI